MTPHKPLSVCPDSENGSSVLMIYTGGTIGMLRNPKTGVLEAFDFEFIEQHVPEIKCFGYNIDTISFDQAIDSSDMDPDQWVKIVEVIEEHYDDYDGFVVLHGTDTMAYTASALSFMLDGLAKPVVLTGSQLPIGMLRTDGKENLITAIEIAAAKDDNNKPYVAEVCVLFDNLLLRGNRSTKASADHFDAFASPNYPVLAHVGIDIHYDRNALLPLPTDQPFAIHREMDRSVITLRVLPGLTERMVRGILNIEGLKGVVLETYGTGNAPTADWFLHCIQDAIARGIVFVNVTQCVLGCVDMKRYGTGVQLLESGVVSGYDSTVESAVTKLMYLFGSGLSSKEVSECMFTDLRGEITPRPESHCGEKDRAPHWIIRRGESIEVSKPSEGRATLN